jgi:hypothetical protein
MTLAPTNVGVRIVIESPPSGVDFGVQSGKGSVYDTHFKQRSTGDDLTFSFTISMKTDGATTDFASGYVQGKPKERFIYIVIGTMAGQEDSPWTRRIKVPLAGVTANLVRQWLKNPEAVLQARIPGTGMDGGPSCATCHPVDGWEVL